MSPLPVERQARRVLLACQRARPGLERAPSEVSLTETGPDPVATETEVASGTTTRRTRLVRERIRALCGRPRAHGLRPCRCQEQSVQGGLPVRTPGRRDVDSAGPRTTSWRSSVELDAERRLGSDARAIASDRCSLVPISPARTAIGGHHKQDREYPTRGAMEPPPLAEEQRRVCDRIVTRPATDQCAPAAR